MDALTLDGNAAAGLLQEIFAAEMTTAVGTCDNCGGVNQVGAARLYSGAGIVLRCPICGEPVMRIVTDGSRVWIDLRGLRTLQLEA